MCLRAKHSSEHSVQKADYVYHQQSECAHEQAGKEAGEPAARGGRTSSCTMLGWPAARRWNAICRRTAAATSAGPRSMKRITTGVSRSASRHRSTEVQRPLQCGDRVSHDNATRHQHSVKHSSAGSAPEHATTQHQQLWCNVVGAPLILAASSPVQGAGAMLAHLLRPSRRWQRCPSGSSPGAAPLAPTACTVQGARISDGSVSSVSGGTTSTRQLAESALPLQQARSCPSCRWKQ